MARGQGAWRQEVDGERSQENGDKVSMAKRVTWRSGGGSDEDGLGLKPRRT
jgi:hypothetical protein